MISSRKMHDILLNAVFNLTDSLRSSALELDRSGDGEIDCVENKALLKLLQKELPEVTLKVNEIGALASAFEGSAGCLVVDDFMYSLEQTALSTLSSQPPSRQEQDYHQYEEAQQQAEEGRLQQHRRVVTAPANTKSSILLQSIQRKLRTRSSSGVSTENRLFLDMNSSRSSHISLHEMITWFQNHGLSMTIEQLSSVLELIVKSTSQRGTHAFRWPGANGDTSIDYHEFDNLIAGLLLPTGSTGRLYAPAPWERADRYSAASAADRAKVRFQTNARVRAREALAAACTALAHEAWTDTELLLALSRKLESTNTSLVDAFRKADTDGAGLLTVTELTTALCSLDLGVTTERAAALVQAFDRTGNGKIACYEFIRMLNSQPDTLVEDVTGLSIDGGTSTTATNLPRAADSKEEASLTRSDSKVEPLLRSDSKADVPPSSMTTAVFEGSYISETVLAECDRKTLLEFRTKLEDERIKMRDIFKKFDSNGSKTITSTELRHGLHGLGIDLDDIQASRLAKRFDLEGDGRLHYYEFVKLFHNLPPSCVY